MQRVKRKQVNNNDFSNYYCMGSYNDSVHNCQYVQKQKQIKNRKER